MPGWPLGHAAASKGEVIADERKFADAASLRPWSVRPSAGTVSAQVERLSGGSKKGAYRLTMDEGSTRSLYAWTIPRTTGRRASRDADDPADPFSHASGLALFEAARAAWHPPAFAVLSSCSSNCPDLCIRRKSRWWRRAGGSLEALLEKDPVAAERPMSVLPAGWSPWPPSGPRRTERWRSSTRRPFSPDVVPEVMLDLALAQLAEIAGATGAPLVLRAASRRRCTRWPSPSSRARPAALIHANSARTMSCSTAAASRADRH